MLGHWQLNYRARLSEISTDEHLSEFLRSNKLHVCETILHVWSIKNTMNPVAGCSRRHVCRSLCKVHSPSGRSCARDVFHTFE